MIEQLVSTGMLVFLGYWYSFCYRQMRDTSTKMSRLHEDFLDALNQKMDELSKWRP